MSSVVQGKLTAQVGVNIGGAKFVEILHADYGTIYTIHVDDHHPNVLEISVEDNINGIIIDMNTLDRE